jgi:hypothetical protein
MQRYTIFFINVDALHVPGGFSAHHQELKNCTHRIGFMSSLLLLPLAVAAASLARTRCCVYSFELLMMGEETARNRWGIDSNKKITLHLVGCI